MQIASMWSAKMGMSKSLCSAEREEQVWLIYCFALEIQLFCSPQGSSESQPLTTHIPEPSEE